MGRPVINKCAEKQVSQPQNLLDDMMQSMPPQSNDSRIVMLHSEINEHTIAFVISQLFHLASQNHKPIHLVISTYGGSVDEMLSLYDVIKFLPCPVHTIALGKVMSAGVLLLASGVKGSRMIGKSARIMIHPVSGTVGGDVFTVQNEANEQRRLHDLMIDCLCKETKMSKKVIDEIMKAGHDYFMLPTDAIKMGIVDKVIGE